ncbi:MAG: hypothetical protein GX604_07800 [Actinobacteria bacterium]|nr:hypothetical protein [Actinomycetota bacterium]
MAVVILVLLLAAPDHAEAYAPGFPSAGVTLENSTPITSPGKSRVLYGALPAGGDARYFQVQLSQGERIRLSVLTPDRTAFAPSLAVMGPGLTSEGSTPAFLEIPQNAQSVVIPGRRVAPDYQPFTPGAYFFTAEVDLTVSAAGLYHVAVFAEEAGAFGLTVGHRGHFTLLEWLLLPYSMIRVYLWEGDGVLLSLGPAVLALLLGLGAVVWWAVATRRKLSLFRWAAVIAGILYLSTAVNMLAQMVQAVLVVGATGGLAVTIALVVTLIVAGAMMLRVGLLENGPTLYGRITLGVLGLAGLGLSAGFVAGPLLAVLAAVLPPQVTAWGSSREGLTAALDAPEATVASEAAVAEVTPISEATAPDAIIVAASAVPDGATASPEAATSSALVSSLGDIGPEFGLWSTPTDADGGKSEQMDEVL